MAVARRLPAYLPETSFDDEAPGDLRGVENVRHDEQRAERERHRAPRQRFGERDGADARGCERQHPSGAHEGALIERGQKTKERIGGDLPGGDQRGDERLDCRQEFLLVCKLRPQQAAGGRDDGGDHEHLAEAAEAAVVLGRHRALGPTGRRAGAAVRLRAPA